MRAGRSRKGAWIEMSLLGGALSNSAGRSRKGAWIEIANVISSALQANGRSRKGAWIEILVNAKESLKRSESLP